MAEHDYDQRFSQSFIVMNRKDVAKMSREEAEKKLEPENINRKEALAPAYILEILKNNSGKKFKTLEICSELTEYPYALEIESKAVRRYLLTLAVNEENICGMQVGRDLYFWYSEDGPEEGYLTIDDLDEYYDDPEE